MQTMAIDPAELLAEARELLTLGYARAAAMMGRVAIEKLLIRWCEHAGCLPRDCRFRTYTRALAQRELLARRQLARVQSCYDLGNRAAHGGAIDAAAAAEVLAGVAELLALSPVCSLSDSLSE